VEDPKRQSRAAAGREEVRDLIPYGQNTRMHRKDSRCEMRRMTGPPSADRRLSDAAHTLPAVVTCNVHRRASYRAAGRCGPECMNFAASSILTIRGSSARQRPAR
jgi:hypothetical protein